MTVSEWSRYNGHLDQRQDLLQRPFAQLRAALRERRAGIDRDAVREHRDHQALHVVRNHVLAAFHQRQRLRRAIQRLRSARADAHRQRFMAARLLDDREHVIHQAVVDGHLPGLLLQAQQLGG